MLRDMLFEAKQPVVEYHYKLNPKLWDGDRLKSKIISRLLFIADDYKTFLKIPNLEVEDIIVTGSNANFNWTENSDIDLHLVVDLSKLKDTIDSSMLEQYNKLAKTVYNDMHNIRIFGYKVELYLQDKLETTPKDQGTYSIMNKKWVAHPQSKHLNLNDTVIKKKIKDFTDRIKLLAKHGSVNSLPHIAKLKDELSKMRTHGLSRTGEFSVENIVFKALRNRGYLEKLSLLEKKLADKKLSLG